MAAVPCRVGRSFPESLRGHRFLRKESGGKEGPKGESFDSFPLWNPPFNDQGRGTAVPLALEPSPSCPISGRMACGPYFVTALRARGPFTLGSFQRGATAVGPSLVVSERGWPRRGEDRNPPSGRFRGCGGALAAKRPHKVISHQSDQSNSRSSHHRNLPYAIMRSHRVHVLRTHNGNMSAEGFPYPSQCPPASYGFRLSVVLTAHSKS